MSDQRIQEIEQTVAGIRSVAENAFHGEYSELDEASLTRAIGLIERQQSELASLRQEREDRIANTGEVSDGYHTFNELYHHRAVLFSVICNEHPELAWKSLHHHKGGQPMYEKMFIVGINTPSGQATYHYDIDPYWDMFDVRAIDNAPEWDGHTPMQAIERIASLSREQEQQEPKPLGLQTIYFTPYSCEYCGDHLAIGWAFCPECGHQTKNKIAATEPKGDAT